MQRIQSPNLSTYSTIDVGVRIVSLLRTVDKLETELTAAKSEWKFVENGLPNESGDYLVLRRKFSPCFNIAWFYEGEWFEQGTCKVDADTLRLNHTFAWQKLPPPTEMENEK